MPMTGSLSQLQQHNLCRSHTRQKQLVWISLYWRPPICRVSKALKRLRSAFVHLTKRLHDQKVNVITLRLLFLSRQPPSLWKIKKNTFGQKMIQPNIVTRWVNNFTNIWPFTTMNIWPNNIIIGLKIAPKTTKRAAVGSFIERDKSTKLRLGHIYT